MLEKEHKKDFKEINISILTISDTRSLSSDTSGTYLEKEIIDFGHNVISRKIVPDHIDGIVSILNTWIDDENVDVIITTGGTGLTGRDVTPEAFNIVIDKEIPGFGEYFRYISIENIGTSTIQSRALAGLAKKTYLFALPGSNGAVRDAWEKILKYQLDVRHKPCNFIELIPRLNEK